MPRRFKTKTELPMLRQTRSSRSVQLYMSQHKGRMRKLRYNKLHQTFAQRYRRKRVVKSVTRAALPLEASFVHHRHHRRPPS